MFIMNEETESDIKNIQNTGVSVENYRKLVRTYINLHLYKAALFWADKVVCLTSGDPRDVYWLAQCMFLLKQYHRAANLLKSRNLDKCYILCNSLVVRCLWEANELKEALNILKLIDMEIFLHNISIGSEAFSTIEEGMFDDTPKYQVASSVLLLKAKVLEAMDNRGLAAACYKQALQCDVHCYEAFECLIDHNMLKACEEHELINSLPFSLQCSSQEAEMLLLLYRMKLKKYHTPTNYQPQTKILDISPFPKSSNVTPLGGSKEVEESSTPFGTVPHLSTPVIGEDKISVCVKTSTDLNLLVLQKLESSLDLAVCKAEEFYYNCDYLKCINLTERILKQDPFHSGCLPIHISCLVELKQSNKLFTLGHSLVDLYPSLAISWFAVGCYYCVIRKSDSARKYLSKATTLNRLFGPAWLAYGHSFALENEHDQAMAAYFKASQLMKGCHLPLMYIALECGLTNNIRLAEKFFQQATEIAPDDPFLLHEMGVIAFQNLSYSYAEENFREALKIIKTRRDTIMPERWAPLYNNLGHTLRKQKKYEEALLSHQEALVLMPQCASTYSAIAYVHALMNNLEEAVEWFHRALGLRRDDTFSTTMLNYAIEHLAEEQPPYPDAPNYIPDFEKPEEPEIVPAETENNTPDQSMSCDMDITDASTAE